MTTIDRAARDLYRAEARRLGETVPGDPLILGLDPSATATGIAHVDGSFSTIRPRTKPTEGDATARARRLHEILTLFEAHLRGKARPTLAVIEGYSLSGARGYASSHLAEVGGALRLRLFELGATLLEVPPTRLKKYATGDGGRKTGKDQMVASAVLDLRLNGPLGPDLPRNGDEADAYWLRRLGLDLVSTPAEVGVDRSLARLREKIRGQYEGKLPCLDS